MDYNNLKNDNGVYLYKDDSFKTIYILLNFIASKGNKEDAIHSLLCRYLVLSNKKYNSDVEINKRKEELYSMQIGFYPYFVGSKKLFGFYADMISPNAINDDYSFDAFMFMKEILLNPDFTNNDVLEMVKRTYLSSITHSLSNHEKYSMQLYNSLIYDSIDEKFRYSIDIEYITNMINSITLDDLKNAYNNIINEENFYRGLVFGNIMDEEFESFREIIPFSSNKEKLHFSNKLELKEQTVEIDNNSMNESIVYVTYSMDISDMGLCSLLLRILNGSSGICMQILREKYGLVYKSYASINYNNKTLCFFAMIDKENKEKLLMAIDEIVEILNDKEQIASYLEYSKKLMKNKYYTLSEDRGDIIDKLDNYICGIFDGFNENEFENNIDSYTENDVIDCVKTLKRKKFFMYRGCSNEQL